MLAVMYNNHISHNINHDCVIGLRLFAFSLRCWEYHSARCTSALWNRSEALCSDLLAVGYDTASGKMMERWEGEGWRGQRRKR